MDRVKFIKLLTCLLNNLILPQSSLSQQGFLLFPLKMLVDWADVDDELELVHADDDDTEDVAEVEDDTEIIGVFLGQKKNSV